MFQSNTYRLIELFIIFVIVPVSFAMSYPVLLKLIIGLIGFIYILYLIIVVERIKFRIEKTIQWKKFWSTTLLKLLAICIITMVYIWFYNPSKFFTVVIDKPILWMFILFIYSVFSVYPQELIYRTFFFQRYQSLFRNDTLFLIINASLFSLAHIFFRNALVMFLTFIGGLLFAFTFQKTKSTLLVSVEHALYGCWLFTVGMGDMLGFPS